MDQRLGQILDEVDSLKITSDTIVIFASDNGPEFRRPWRGTVGPWSGTYHTSLEGGLRVPFLIRWRGQLPAGRVESPGIAIPLHSVKNASISVYEARAARLAVALGSPFTIHGSRITIFGYMRHGRK